MLENAVLLDSVIVTDPSSKMDKSAAFMHHFYCPVSVDGQRRIAKLYITENVGNEHKFYLTKIEMEPSDSMGQSRSSDPKSSNDSNSVISVANIFNFVKKNNSNFEKDSDEPTEFSPKPVNHAMLNEEGMPKKFYHGTDAVFTAFDPKKAEAL